MILVLASVTLSLLAAELAIEHWIVPLKPLTQDGYLDTNEMARISALSRHDSFDQRNIHQVILDVRAGGRKAFPALSPSYFLRENGSLAILKDGRPVIPLGIAAASDNYYCNESGSFARFSTDRFGFRNPEEVWESSPDIVALGDSFTMGSCLDAEKSIVGNLRAASRKVLNLGMSSNGPLVELASLVEYGIKVRPKIVLWNFFPNDFVDLDRESKNPILRHYLDKGYSQGLMLRQSEINSTVEAIAGEYWKAIDAHYAQKTASPSEPLWRLPEMRKYIRYVTNSYTVRKAGVAKVNLKGMIDVLSRAQTETKAAGAKLYFVFIPDCTQSSYGQNQWKEKLMASVRQMGIGVIDTEPGIADLKGEGYYFCPGSHLSAAGAKAAARQIMEELEATSQ